MYKRQAEETTIRRPPTATLDAARYTPYIQEQTFQAQTRQLTEEEISKLLSRQFQPDEIATLLGGEKRNLERGPLDVAAMGVTESELAQILDKVRYRREKRNHGPLPPRNLYGGRYQNTNLPRNPSDGRNHNHRMPVDGTPPS